MEIDAKNTVYLSDHTLISHNRHCLQTIVNCLGFCDSGITWVNGAWIFEIVGERSVLDAKNLDVVPTCKKIDELIRLITFGDNHCWSECQR